MAMDFFEQQQRARKRTGFLLFWFLLAVVLIVLALNAAVWLAAGGAIMSLAQWLQQPWWKWTTGLALLVIGIGSLSSYLSLRSGGGAVLAKSVGARRVLSSTVEARERVLLNVVEEMAIASGMPVPSVWVMDDESSINAFVAGFSPTQAVLVVTRGALDAFDREELQGVVGHEFSHILNGDMRLNVQLYAILAGVLLIGSIGAFLLRSSGNVRYNRDSSKAIPVIAMAGLALYVIGYSGLFCGRIIKAAISRQREFLADASSVQFTRNPQGIGEALLTIRNASSGTQLRNPHAEDLSHMCLAPSINLGFTGLFATHPPIDERIRAIDSTLLARDRARKHLSAQPPATPSASASIPSPVASGFAGFTTHSLSAMVGQPSAAHYERAQRIHVQLPEVVRQSLQTGDGAKAVIYGLIIANQAASYDAVALQQLAASENAELRQQTTFLLPTLRAMNSSLNLPCLDLAIPALRALSSISKRQFLLTLESLVHIDGALSLREYLALSLLRKHLADDTYAFRPVRYRNYRAVAQPLNAVFSMLCLAAADNAAARTALHARLLASFGISNLPMLPPSALSTASLHAALTDLADLAPLLKKPVLDTCLDAVRYDGRVAVGELELVRAIAEALDCPVPPQAD